MNEQESLILIRDMISRARGEVKDGGYFFLLWGWLVVSGCVLHYGLWDLIGPAIAAVVWAGVGALGGIGTWVGMRRQRAKSGGRSYGTGYIQQTWTAVAAVLLILTGLGIGQVISFEQVYPMYIFLYGLGTYITGGIISFRPLQIGALLAWGLAIGAFFVGVKEQLLLIGLAIIFTYLIPGYLLKRAS